MKYNINHLICLCLTSFLLLLEACSSSSTSNTEAMDPAPVAISNFCAECHGEDLKGNIAQSLLDGSWQFGSRRNDIFRSIKFGHPHHGMPSWGAVLPDSEIDSLVRYLLAQEEKLGISKPPIPTELETQDYLVNVEVMAEGLETPWSIAFTGDKDAYVTEKDGTLRVIENGTLLPDTVVGLPQVRSNGQGGLMDVAVDPQFEDNQWIYLSFSHPIEKREGEEVAPAMTSIVRGHIKEGAWQDHEVLFEAAHEHYRTAGHHFGSRIVFDRKGFLYFSIGDRGASDHAQDITKPNGKIHRIHPDGRIPNSNPFVNNPAAVKSIFSFGHRNPQGLAVHPETDQVWDTEHGPLGGDELNLIESGLNYGWPVISYGINYNGEIITDIFRKEGMEQPIFYWKPSIATCGLDFYSGNLFPKWKNRLMVGALKFEEVQLLDIEKDRVMYRQTILKNAGRVRDVTTGPDGAIYIVLNRPGVILRLSPKPSV